MKQVAYLALAAICLCMTPFAGASSAERSAAAHKAFFGKYVGRSISVVGEGLSERDFNVTISPYEKDGFKVEWTTVIRYTDTSKDTQRKTHAVSFLPVRKRPGLYYSAAGKDVFGNQAPADPLTGEPYVWAGIDGATLTLTALYITDSGGYEVQVYKRVLTADGMDTHFERIRDGVQQRLITGRLEKVK